MSSVTSSYAQVARRLGYFRCLADVSGYAVAENTSTYNDWTITSTGATTTTYTSGSILEDMGEIARIGGATGSGQILRKVRNVTQVTAGGALPTYFIVMPGGELPISVAGSGSVLAVAAVARLG